jgi:hypothetical protein
LSADDSEEACKSWKKVFGDAWPEDDAKESAALHRSILNHVAAVSSTGTVFTTKPVSVKTVEVRAGRAYGAPGGRESSVQ